MRINKRELRGLSKEERKELWSKKENVPSNQMTLEQFLKSDIRNVTRKKEAS